MRTRILNSQFLIVNVLAVALPAATAGAQSRPNAGATCNRACLVAMVDQYLDALVAHDPFGLPLAPVVRFSENDQVLPLGDGLWNTATGRGTYRVVAADPTRGQVAFFGTLRENDSPITATIRLKVEKGRISEIETTVLREGGAPNGPPPLAVRLEQGSPDALLVETVPAAERVSRDTLLTAANTHFDALEHQEDRTVYPRRYPVVDEERQIVLGAVMLQDAGDTERRTAPAFFDRIHLLRVKGGKVAQDEGVTVSLPFGTATPFFSGDWRKGNRSPSAFPAVARTAPTISTGPCDRACLEGHVNAYLAAMVAHDPSRLPLAASVRFTENDVPLRLGDAAWRTVTALGTYKLYVVDPPAGQVGFFGTIRENGRPAALVLRLKIDNGAISEAETLVVRNEGTANNLEKAGAPDPVLLETVPPSERLPRATLIATTNTYFEAIEQGNGAVAPFAADCNRFENGVQTSGPLGCSAQLDTKTFDYIQKIHPRRFPVVDQERQIVFGFFMFHHPGDILWVNAGGGRREMFGAAKRPLSVDVAELFRIKDKRIRKVEALMQGLPYGARSPFVPQ